MCFKVDDMTVSKGNIYEFNHNWTLTWPDKTSYTIEELPYLGQSEPGEMVIFENTIPKEYAGKTMSFLSADKTLRVWIDGEIVYEFGIDDERSFGHTPGSVMNFIDIPENLTEGKIQMEMVSPYPDYAARVTAITVGERDVLIICLLKDKMFDIVCNLVIIFCGIIFFLLSIIQRVSGQKADGVLYLCGYCIVAALYYFVETKVLQIFYGNQTFYSVLVFLCIMMIPFFIALYYANGIFSKYKMRWQILLGLICMNIVLQIILQLCNIVDFMNMSFFSHGLIMLTVLVVAKSYYDLKKENCDKSVRIGVLALLFMGLGGSIDIVRMYVVAVGDMGKYSRLGSTCFSIIMLYHHFSHMLKGYFHNVAENENLLKNKMELIEKKNEELKKASELAEEARQEAIEANASKGRFLAHMSHEIRTPINAVLGMDTMILRETKDMQIKEYALDIQNAGQNLLALINDILDFSKIESGKLEIIHVEYDFSSLIHDISNMIKAKAEAKKLKLEIYADETLPSKLYGDDVRIRQVLVNLLNNAVKYTKEGCVSLRITGKVEGRKVIFDFCVEDTGIGIKEEDIDKLFREFERIEEKRNRNIEGTGLGINITTQILQLMGSKLQVESVYGKGSRFFFSLEQQIVDSTPIGNLEQRIREQSTDYSYMATLTILMNKCFEHLKMAEHICIEEENSASQTAKEGRKSILAVDDSGLLLRSVKAMLEKQYDVSVATSGMKAINQAKKKRPDIILLDYEMPEWDGKKTFEEILKDEELRDIKVIFLTAVADRTHIESVLRLLPSGYLLKPIEQTKLIDTIEKVLSETL